MTTSVDTIVNRYTERRKSLGAVTERMRQVREIYENRADVVLPELEDSIPGQPSTANLILQTVDQLGTRIASRVADVAFWPTNSSEKAAKRAAKKRRVALGWWENWEIEVKDGRQARRLVAYSSAPSIIRPDPKLCIPKRHLLDPLHTFPSSMTDPDDMDPLDVVFDYKRSLGWLRDNYPVQCEALKRHKTQDDDHQVVIVEYNDADETVLIAVGEAHTHGMTSINMDIPAYTKGGRVTHLPGEWVGVDYAVELERIPNLAGICRAVTPGRVTLDRPQGHVDGMVGPYMTSAYLFALEIEAVKRGIFANEWIQLNDNGEVVVAADGVRGIVGEIRNGTVQAININPGYKTDQALGMIERTMRQNGRVPAEMGGEGAVNARTGRRGEQIMSATIDFDVAEAHRVLGRSKQHELVRAIEVSKGYFGSQKKSFYVDWRGAKGHVDYVPNELFDSSQCTVKYCVDAETEALTRSGWKKYTELAVGEQLLTLNPLTGLSEWQPIEEMHIFPAERRGMFSMESPSHSSLTTGNHRWLVRKPKWKRTGSKAVRVGTKTEFTTTADLKLHDAVPLCAPYAEFPTEPKYSDALVEAVAWFWTEGHIRPGGGVVIAQSLKVNPINVGRIRAALTGVFGPSVETVLRYDHAEPAWREAPDDGRTWCAHLSSKAGPVLTEHAPGRVPTHEFLLSLTAAQLELFIERSLDADGSRVDCVRGARQRSLAQKSLAAAEAFQFACTLAGLATSIRTGRPNGILMHRVYLRTRTTIRPKAAAGKGSAHVNQVVQHDGIVWCPQTANHTWLARRRGSVYFTGNSHAGADVNNLNVGIGSMKGLEILSTQTAMEMHPWIDDPEKEMGRITAQRLDMAIEAQLLVPGAATVPDLARARELVQEKGLTLHEALLEAQREAQVRQATSGAPGEPDGPVDPNSPEAMPGMAPPGMGVEAGAFQPGPTDSMSNVAQLLGAVRRPVMTVAAERTA